MQLSLSLNEPTNCNKRNFTECLTNCCLMRAYNLCRVVGGASASAADGDGGGGGAAAAARGSVAKRGGSMRAMREYQEQMRLLDIMRELMQIPSHCKLSLSHIHSRRDAAPSLSQSQSLSRVQAGAGGGAWRRGMTYA